MAAVCLLVCLVVGPRAAMADAGLFAAADDQSLWIVTAETVEGSEKLNLFLHRTVDTEVGVKRVFGVTGSVLQGNLTVGGDALWLVYKGGNDVQKFFLVKEPTTGRPVKESRFMPSLPPKAIVRSIAANEIGAWALVRIEDAETLKLIDARAAGDGQNEKPDAGGRAGAPANAGDGSGATGAAPEREPAAPRQPVAADRLLGLEGGKWKKIDLPEDWSDDSQSWVRVVGERDQSPTLISIEREEDDGYALRVFSQNPMRKKPSSADDLDDDRNDENGDGDHGDVGDGDNSGEEGRSGDTGDSAPADDDAEEEPDWPTSAWIYEHYTLDHMIDLDPIVVNGQFVVGRKSSDTKSTAVELTLLFGGQPTELGALSIPMPPAEGGMALTAFADLITLVARDGEQKTYWTQMDLRGQITREPGALATIKVNNYVDAAGYILMVGVMAVSMFLLFTFWRRTDQPMPGDLRTNERVAELARRMVGGLVDLAPGVLLVWVLFDDMSPRKLFDHWPLEGLTLGELVPPLLMLGCYFLLSLPCELFFARTPGKWLTGTHITTKKGTPPRMWQVIARNVLKVFDLIAWPLLILPILSPMRQRLADVVAATVVVRTCAADEEDGG